MTGFPVLLATYFATAGISLCSGMHALVARFVGRQGAAYLAFAIVCFCAAGYQLSSAAFYMAQDVARAVRALHWQILSVSLGAVGLYAFVSLYVGRPRLGPGIWVVGVISAAQVLADQLLPLGVRFERMELASPTRLPWGETLGQVTGHSGLGRSIVLFVPFFTLIAWMLRTAAVQYFGGNRSKALMLAACIAMLAASAVAGILIDSGVIRSIYLAGFAFLGFVLLMSVNLGQAQGRAVEELGSERDRLQRVTSQLEASEMRLRLVLKGSNDAWWDWNIVTDERYYSPRGWERLGYVPDELPYDEKLWERLVYPEDRNYSRQMFVEALASGRDNYRFELRMRHKDGHPIPVLSRGHLLRDPQGRAIRVSGTDTDLTETKQAMLALRNEQRLNEQIFANSPMGICIFDKDGQCLAANEAIARQIGATVEQIRAQNFHHIESWRRSGFYEHAIRTLRTGEPTSKIIFVETTFGKNIWMYVNFRLLPDDNTGRLLLMTDDLTEFKLAEQQRKEIQNSYEMLFTHSMEGVLRTMPDGAVLAANPAACEMLGMSEAEVCRRGRTGLLDTSDPRYAPLLEQRRRHGRARGEVRMVRSNGEGFEAEISSAIYHDRDGQALASTMFRDITERKNAEAEAFRLAYIDPLTGLPNRRMLLDRIRLSLESSARSGQIGALLFLDLDDFKRINDARGHSVGDRLLVQVALRLGGLLRAVDLVGRLGGDEFVILINELGRDMEPAARSAMLVAERALDVLESPYVIDNFTYNGTGSIGVTMFPKGRENVDDLLREADTAMYRAKALGRNRISYYESSMQTEVQEHLALEQDLKSAIDAGQIAVYVQPQFDITGGLIGGELLLRWNHAQRGNVPPARFIPVAEQSGLILALGDLVIRQAAETLVRIQACGAGHSLSVNISPRQFRQEDFVERVRDMMAQARAPASRLIFEVTENLLIDDLEVVASRMTALAAMGIRFSIDDFGTGYSSLAYLKRLPLHEIKIDKSFVQDTPADPNDTAIVRSIIAIAKHFRLRVVAEGVETRAQANFLASAECDGLQGFLYAAPMPLQDWLEGQVATLDVAG